MKKVVSHSDEGVMEINVRKLQRRRKALNKEEKIMGGSPVVKEIHYKALEAQ